MQGIGSVGATPKLKDAILDRLQSNYGVELPTAPGLDTMACMDGARSRELLFGMCLGGNLYGSNPDSKYAAEALAELDLLVSLNTTLNTGHAHALAAETIILPVLARDEEPAPTTQESMFNLIRLSDGGAPRHAGPRSEIDVISHIALATLGDDGPLPWSTMDNPNGIRQVISRVVPGFESLNDIDQTRSEFQIEGRTFHKPKFATADGRARMHVHELPELLGSDDELRLMTVRSEGQFNTVVYEDDDLYRGIEGRDVVLLHPDDLRRLNLSDGQRVTVLSTTGSLPGIRAVAFEQIRAGNVLMYYPEANVLVGRGTDPLSKTPAFKGILVRLEKQS